jgi:hypothetical protein
MRQYPIPEDIIEALHIIQTVCESNGDCIACPFSRTGTDKCMIRNDNPSEWCINTSPPTVWKALD